MNSNDKIIEISKDKAFHFILATFFFILLMAFIYFIDKNYFFRGLAVLLAVFGVFFVIFIIKKLIKKKPLLVFDKLGITDNTSTVAVGFIPWSEITGTAVFQMYKQNTLIVKVRNPEKYIAEGNIIKRMFKRINYKMFGTPITISGVMLDIEFDELLSIFKNYHGKYK